MGHVIKGVILMNFKKRDIKAMTDKALRLSTDFALISKEKANILFTKIKVYIHNSKVWIENKWNKRDLSFLCNVHFNLHHLTTVCTVGLLAFFVTLYTTGANTSDVNAFDTKEVASQSFNDKAITVSYGDKEALAEIAKNVLGNKISLVNEPQLLSTADNEYVYAMGDYVTTISLMGEKKLGSSKAQIRVENKATYSQKNQGSIEVFSDDTKAKVENGVACIYTVDLNVIDAEAPQITLSRSDITLEEDDTFVAADYLVAITDNYDGTIAAYSVEGEVAQADDKLEVGEYTLTYRASDSSKNEASATLKVSVEASEAEEASEEDTMDSAYRLQADSPYAGSIVSEARRLIGSAYVYGGSGPTAFDCSGFVQYVYSRAGISVPRTSGAQSTFGNAIDPNDRSQWRAGDIITFGAGGNEHAAIYSGSGTLIHALNPSLGVMETGVFGNVYAVRRP